MSDRQDAMEQIVKRCKAVVAAHERRSEKYDGVTLNEEQALWCLRFALDEFAEWV